MVYEQSRTGHRQMRLTSMLGIFANDGGINENISGSMGSGPESDSEAGGEDASEKSES